MKKNILIILVFATLLFVANCGSMYDIKSENPVPAPSLKSFKQIHMGWLDLDVNNWKELGYNSKKEWNDVIGDMNHNAVKEHSKEWMPDKNFTYAARTDEFPTKGDLYVKFSDTVIEQNWNFFTKSSDAIEVTLQFFDIKTKKELYKVRFKVHEAQSSSWGELARLAFEGRLNNTIYNVIRFISEKVNP